MLLFRNIKTTALIVTIMLISFVLGTSSAFAYEILHNGGFSSFPANFQPLNTFASESKTAMSNAAATWNDYGSNVGPLVYRGSDTTNTTYPNKNNLNEVTKGYRGTNNYLMQTNYTTVWYCNRSTGNYLCNQEADIDVNIDKPWANNGTSTAFDIQNCFTHELGHFLGLNDENDVPYATMYGAGKIGETQKRTLDTDDIWGIRAIHWK